MYLERLPWRKRKARKNEGLKNKGFKGSSKKILGMVLGLFILMGSSLFLLPEDSPVLTTVYKSTLGTAYAAAPGKVIRLYIKRGYQLLCQGLFPLGNAVSIVEKRTPLDIPLDGVRFAVYNTERQYFAFPATDWIYPARVLNSKKIKKEEAAQFLKHIENLSAAFKTIPYFDKNKRFLDTARTLLEPFLNSNRKLPQWTRKFADGKVRLIVPKDNWLILQPNIRGQEVRNGPIDKKLNIPVLAPEESLPVALWVFTTLGDWETGEWDIPLTQWLISREYAIAYGIYLPPEKIEIKGKGVKTRFIFRDKLLMDQACVVDKYGRTRILPLRNHNNELLFWTSQDPSQSIFIPFSYLWKMYDEKDKIFLAGGTYITDMREIKEELQQVQDNKRYAVNFDRENLQAYVVDTPRLQEIANRLISNYPRDTGLAKLVDYTNIAMPYVSDFKRNLNSGYNGPREIPYPPTLGVMNRGGDCEDHAILFAALFLSSSLKNSNLLALSVLIYRPNHEGHVIPMIPLEDNLELSPYPNYASFNGIPYAYIEATGYGENEMHQTRPTLNGYQPLWMEIIHQNGASRTVKTVGFNQFRYDIALAKK